MAKPKTDPTGLPVVEGLSWHKTKAGYAVFYHYIRGDQIIRHEVIAGPDSYAAALDGLGRAIKRLLAPKN